MLAGGEQPLYIARRLVRAAVEDIGLADPEAVHQALAAKDVFDFLGPPEGELALAQAVIYLASAPKSNAVYKAFGAAQASAEQHGSLPPPAHILNAPAGLMRRLGYGAGYEYDHATEEAFSGQNYSPRHGTGALRTPRTGGGTGGFGRNREVTRPLGEAGGHRMTARINSATELYWPLRFGSGLGSLRPALLSTAIYALTGGTCAWGKIPSVKVRGAGFARV